MKKTILLMALWGAGLAAALCSCGWSGSRTTDWTARGLDAKADGREAGMRG